MKYRDQNKTNGPEKKEMMQGGKKILLSLCFQIRKIATMK